MKGEDGRRLYVASEREAEIARMTWMTSNSPARRYTEPSIRTWGANESCTPGASRSARGAIGSRTARFANLRSRTA